MKKIIVILLMLMVVSFVACQKAPSKETMEKGTGVMEKPTATSDATVDSVGNDLNNVDNVDKDLSSEELSDLDSGLSDVDSI